MAPVEHPVSLEDFSGPLVPLAEAARLAYFRTNGKHTDNAGVLNRIARLIAQSTRVFTRAHDEDDWHLVMPDELSDGLFHLGGSYLEFADARPSLGNLAVLRRELPAVLSSLEERLKAYKQPPRK